MSSSTPTESTPPSPTGSSLSDILGSQLPAEPAGTTWQRVAEDAGQFSFEVPTTWIEHRTVPWEEASVQVGTLVIAGPRTASFTTDFGVPGVAIGVSRNPSGRSARDVLEEDDFAAVCTPDPTQVSSTPEYTAATRLWSSCGGTADAFVLQVVIGPTGAPGLVGIILKGATRSDLGYVQHMFGSIRTAGAPPASAPAPPASAPAPPATGGSSSQGYSYNVEECLLQIGDAIAIGTIRNETSVSHSYRVVVRFLAKDGLLIGEYYRDTPALDPGQAYRWEVRWLAQGYNQVTCVVSEVLIHG